MLILDFDTTMFVVAAACCLTSVSVIYFTLRDFSRGKLEQICTRHDRVERFGLILQQRARALLSVECAFVLIVGGSIWLAVDGGGVSALCEISQAGVLPIVALCLRLATMTAGVLLVTVILPRTLSRALGETILYHIWPVISLFVRVTAPLWKVSVLIDRLVHRIIGIPEPEFEDEHAVVISELLSLVDESARTGAIQEKAARMIHRVMDLQREDVAAIMTPRTDMVTISGDTLLADAAREMIRHGFSRVPVVGANTDDIVGILYARDLLAHLADPDGQPADRTARDVARPVLYVPESQEITDLLEAMRQKKVHMAIVVDEYSGVSGLVTLEDILEEIVGEISDEYDFEDDSLWKTHCDGRTEVDARYHLDDLNEEFGYSFPEDEEFDTIGGFVMSLFGRIPRKGESVEWNDVRLTVLDADERRVTRVRIEPLETVSQESSSSA